MDKICQKILIAGCGGHAKSLADSINSIGQYRISGYTSPLADDAFPYPCLGEDECFPQIFESGVTHAVVGIGFMGKGKVRDRVFEQLRKNGFTVPVITDPSATVSTTAAIGEGTFIAKGALINAHASIGRMCIINTGTVLEHDVKVGDFSHIAGGAVLCGEVQVGNHSFIGANATVIQQVKIGNNAIVGAGSVVLAHVPDETTVYGVWKGIEKMASFSVVLDPKKAGV
ncbi:MAG: acetyltransferase [Lachnospiraceae bacterium]|nr:acetyltransferase [Lachnospiraceae bacterium]